MTKAEKQAAIDNLVDTNTKEQLIDLAEAASVPTSGTKEEIATAIIEAEATEDADDDGADGAEENEAPAPADPVDQTQEASMRADACARKEKWVQSGGDPDAPIPDDFGEAKEDGEEK